MTEEQLKAALEVATIAAPIYAEFTLTMKRHDAMLNAVRDAVALIGVAKDFIECA